MNESGGLAIVGDEAMGKVNPVRGQRRMEDLDGHSDVENEQSTVFRFPLVGHRERIEKGDVDVVR